MASKKSIRLCSCIPLIMLYAFSVRAQQMPVPADALPGKGEAPTGESSTQPVAITYSAPRVSCQGNQLTIDAVNSTLGSVLEAVHVCIGVEIMMPDGAAEQRSYVRLGPGPTRDVLDELLSSTKYNYAIQSSSSAPGKISSILLMADAKDIGSVQDNGGIAASPAADAAMTPARRAWLASVRIARTTGMQPDSGASSAVAAEPVTPSSSEGSPSAQTNPSAADTSAAALSPGTPDTLAPRASTQAPPSSESTQQPQSAGDLQNKIDQMQQLFEQRKKMAAVQGQPASSLGP